MRRKIGCPKVYKSSNGRMCKVNKHILSLAMLSSWILLSFIAVDECMLRFNLGEGVLEFTLDSHNTTFTFWNYKFLRGTIYSWKAWAQMTFVLKYWLFLVLIKSKYCKTNTSFCNIYILTHLDRQFCSQCLFFTHYMFVLFFWNRDTLSSGMPWNRIFGKTWDLVPTKGWGGWGVPANPKVLGSLSENKTKLG